MTHRLAGRNSLTQRIQGAAFKIARQYNADPQDVAQDITQAILTRYKTEPTFLDQTDAYIVNHGAWRARDTLKRQFTLWHNRETSGDAYISGGDDDATLFDLIAADDPWQATELQIALARALEMLDDDDRAICLGLAEGYKPRELAEQTGIPQATIYYRMKNQIARTLKNALAEL
jgi:RNA polymerase sigma factor (sigma-70 family)